MSPPESPSSRIIQARLQGDLIDVMHALVSLVFLFVILNPIMDYCSVVETRIILKKIKLSTTMAVVTRLFILDAVLTAVIVFVVFSLLWGLGYLMFIHLFGSALGALFAFFGVEPTPLWREYLTALYYSVHDVWNGFVFCKEGGILSPYIYTTFFTSAWIWLYVVALGMARAFPVFQNHFLNRDRFFQSIGLVVAVFAGLLYFGMGALLAAPDLCITLDPG